MRELRERAVPILRIVIIILAGLVVYQLAGVIVRLNPFRGVTVPELPTLTSSTNSPAGGSHGTNLAAAAKGTNGSPHIAGTNTMNVTTNVGTNVIPASKMALRNTNAVAATNMLAVGTNALTNAVVSVEADSGTTNLTTSTDAPKIETNVVISTAVTTNVSAAVKTANTNSTVQTGAEMTNTNAQTNVIARRESKLGSTNSISGTNAASKGTNDMAAKNETATNGIAGSKKGKKNAPGMPPEMAGMDFNPFGGPGKSSVELPPAVKARISKIVDSEMLGPVFHPMPQALLGIAGNMAFLRSANGQTGLVKEGDLLDDIKLLRIGMNRVLIEQGGEKKELLIFDGYGGESLLQNDSTNENKHP